MHAIAEERDDGSVVLEMAVTNVDGFRSFVLGFLTGLGLYHAFPQTPRVVLGPGFCGAYTTFSTFAVETDLLVKDGHTATAAIYMGSTLVVGLLCAWFGIVMGRWLVGARTDRRSRPR